MTNFLENKKINREYKNDLFIFLFGRNKEFALSLYNAMNNSNYTDPEKITFNTIENFIYVGMKNDVSFLIENTINVYEHQTTINANIALRMFLYVSNLYEKYAFDNRKDLYSQKLIKLPNPNFVVFYCGKDEIEEDRFMYLSEALDNKNSNIELRVRVINANYGHNQHILNKCPALYEYSWFLEEIRIRYNMYIEDSAKKDNVMTEIVDEVLSIMPDEFVIKDIILGNKVEVANMLYTIEDEPRMMAIHEEAIRKETREEDMEKMILAFIDTGYSPNEALKLTEKTYNELPEHLIEKFKEKTNALYTVEDESRMMATHEEAIKKEIREKDIKVMIQAFVDAGFSSEEATRRIEEAFKKLP